MLNVNFFLVDAIKDHIDYLVKNSHLLEINKDKQLIVDHDHMSRELQHSLAFASEKGKLTKYDVGYIFSVVAAIKDGPKMLVPSFDDCVSLEHTVIKVPCSEYQQPFPAMFIEFPYKYYEHMTERWQRPQPKGAIAYHVPHANMIIITLMYKHPEFSSITVFFDTKFAENVTIEDAFVILDNTGVHDVDTKIAKFYQRIIINLMLILTSLGCATYKNTAYNARRGKKILCEEIILVGLKQNIKMFGKEVHGGTGSPLDHERAAPHPHWRSGYHRMQHHGKGNTLKKRIFIPPVFVCSSRYGGDMTDTGATYRHDD